MTAEKGSVQEEVESPDIHFEPIISLDSVEVVTLEEQEDDLLNLRAKLFRYDKSEPDAPQWKERGTGYVKLLKHKETSFVRVLMRRDKTFKICANHYVQPSMDLMPNCGSDKAWVWSTTADFADEDPHPELLAIRFGNAENAQKFKEKFEEAKEIMKTAIKKYREKEPKSPNGTSAASGESPVKSADTSTTSETDQASGDGAKTETEGTQKEGTQKEGTQTEAVRQADSVAESLEKLTVLEKSDTESCEKKDEETQSETVTSVTSATNTTTDSESK